MESSSPHELDWDGILLKATAVEDSSKVLAGNVGADAFVRPAERSDA